MPTTAQIQDFATTTASQYGIPPSLFLSLLNQESHFNQSAVSSAGAIGIGQLMPKTAAQLGVNPNDWEQNIVGSAQYLSNLYGQFGDWTTSVAAYNAGPGRVTDVLNGIKGLPSQTQDYLNKVFGGLGKFGGNFQDFLNESPLDMGGSILNMFKPGAGDPLHSIASFFSSPSRIVIAVIGGVLILLAVWAILSQTKIVKGAVSTVKTAALAAAA